MQQAKERELKKNIERVFLGEEKKEVANESQLPRGAKTICIPINKEEYEKIFLDIHLFRSYLERLLKECPELFPKGMADGYEFHDILPPSVKLGIRMRRIKILTTGHVFSLRPSFIMPYMTGYTEDVEKALFLRRFAVPFWGLTYVFGKNDMYWYRMATSFGRNSLVGTTVKAPELLPEHLLADEKHTDYVGEKAYIATTVGDSCVLGAALCHGAGTQELTEGYDVFAQEANNVRSDYQPKTVNTDGWAATGLAWLKLFPQVTIILCFLHAFISIRDRARRLGPVFHELGDKIWHVYHATTKRIFAQRIRRLKEWATKNLEPGTVQEKVLALCHKSQLFQKTYDQPEAHRTSNMVDRIMKQQDRYLFFTQYFHGHFLSAERSIRAWAVLYNFQPYCSRIVKGNQDWECAAERLNGFRYRENWLENLLVSASMGGYRQ